MRTTTDTAFIVDWYKYFDDNDDVRYVLTLDKEFDAVIVTDNGYEIRKSNKICVEELPTSRAITVINTIFDKGDIYEGNIFENPCGMVKIRSNIETVTGLFD